MTQEKLREAIRARPFRPFAVMTGDGDKYRVSHPEMIAMPPGPARTFIVYTGKREEHVVLDLLLVTGLRFEGRAERRVERNGH